MRDADNVRQVEALTPDMMGFICWEGSRRHVSRLPDYLPETCRRVGVFVNPEIGYVQERLKTFRLDLVQLHGHETPEFCRSIKEEGLKSGRALQIIKAFGVAPDEPFPHTEDYEADCDFFLFDTRCPTAGRQWPDVRLGCPAKLPRTYALLPERRHRPGQCGPSSQLFTPRMGGRGLKLAF